VIRRLVEAGYERLSEGPESLRQFLGDLRLPKETLALILPQLEETKHGLYRVVAREVREFLERTNLTEELTQALTRLSFEIKTEVRFVPNDAGRVGRPQVQSKVAVHREKDGRSPRRAEQPPQASTDSDQVSVNGADEATMDLDSTQPPEQARSEALGSEQPDPAARRSDDGEATCCGKRNRRLVHALPPDLGHRIVAMVDRRPKRVICLTCNSEHNYRPPRSTPHAREARPAPTERASRRSSSKATRRARPCGSSQTGRRMWQGKP